MRTSFLRAFRECTELDYLRALEFAKEKHKGQTRLDGQDFVSHPIAVAEILRNRGFGPTLWVIGVLHDTKEDGGAAYEEIARLFGEYVADRVDRLSKWPGYIAEEYAGRINEDSDSRHAKGADILHNLRTAKSTSRKFREKRIKEVKEDYASIIRGNVFEREIIEALTALELTLV